MVAAVVALASMILLVGVLLLGSLHLLTSALTRLGGIASALTLAVLRSSLATEESIKTAREQLAMNRDLVEAVKTRPAVIAIVSNDPAATKH